MKHYINRYLTLFIILITHSALANNLIINDITVINPINNSNIKILKHQWIEIKNGRIERISSLPINALAKIKEIDGKGKYLIPGLMDAHVHTGNMPGLRDDFKNSEALQVEFLKQQPRSYLYYGITQLLDPSRTPTSVAQFKQAELKPDLFHCGAAPIIGGYTLMGADLNQAIKQRKYFIYQPTKDGKTPQNFDASQHTPEMVVQRMAQDGARCVKVYTEDGFNIANDWPIISDELLLRVRKAATKHGLKMMAHANAVDMQKIAIHANVDIIGHGMWNWLDLPTDTAMLPEEIKTVADLIIKKGITYQPTLNVMRSLRDVMIDNHLTHPDYKNVIPEKAMKWYQSDEGKWFGNEMKRGWENSNQQQINQHMTGVMHQGERVLQYLYKQGHPMILATDTPPAPTYASQPGVAASWELKNMYDLGVSLPHLLAAATINNAQSFGIDDDYGSVEVAKIANLLILSVNPLADIAAYDQIESVIIHGKHYARDEFKVAQK